MEPNAALIDVNGKYLIDFSGNKIGPFFKIQVPNSALVGLIQPSHAFILLNR